MPKRISLPRLMSSYLHRQGNTESTPKGVLSASGINLLFIYDFPSTKAVQDVVSYLNKSMTRREVLLYAAF